MPFLALTFSTEITAEGRLSTGRKWHKNKIVNKTFETTYLMVPLHGGLTKIILAAGIDPWRIQKGPFLQPN